MSFDATTDRRLNVDADLQPHSRTAQIGVPVADLRSAPQATAGLETQLIFGQPVFVFQQAGGWAVVQSTIDGYVGYIAASALTSATATATHRIIVPRTFIYAKPDMKAPRIDALSIGSLVRVAGYAETRGTPYALLENGSALIAGHIAPVAEQMADPVTVAETLLHTPYLWGGTSAFGIDCSGLVQLCLGLCGHTVLRDTDMQAATLGAPVSPAQLQRGDLVFWKGHVAFYRGNGTIIHANGHSMSVAIEGLDDAITRIGYLYGQPTAFRKVGILTAP